jgi:hypothetical protein
VIGTPPPAAPVEPPAPGLLTVSVSSTARISIDGKVVAESVRNARLPVEGGTPHRLEVVAPRKKPHAQTVTVPPGANLELSIKLERTGHRSTNRDYVLDPFDRKR